MSLHLLLEEGDISSFKPFPKCIDGFKMHVMHTNTTTVLNGVRNGSRQQRILQRDTKCSAELELVQEVSCTEAYHSFCRFAMASRVGSSSSSSVAAGDGHGADGATFAQCE